MQLSSNSHLAGGLAFQADRLITIKIFMELIIGVYYEMNFVIGYTELWCEGLSRFGGCRGKYSLL